MGILSFKNSKVYYIKAGDYLEVSSHVTRRWCVVNKLNDDGWTGRECCIDVTILYEEHIGSANLCQYILDEGVVPREFTIWPSMWKLLNIKRL